MVIVPGGTKISEITLTYFEDFPHKIAYERWSSKKSAYKSMLGGLKVNDRAVGLLEQYDIEVLRTRKGRGAVLCDTPQGCLIFKEYAGSEEKISVQNKLLQHIHEQGKVQAEMLIPTKDGALTVKDGDGVSYILKTYCESRECNIYDRAECVEAVKLLAQLHECMQFPADTEWLPAPINPAKEYEKHNRELKKVRKYLQQRSQKTWFEIRLLNTYDLFLEQALAVAQEWDSYRQSVGECPKGSYCHGDYQYHNILRNGEGWFLANFEKCLPDSAMRDLYLLLRKLLEKSNWSVSLGEELLGAYEEVRPISAIDRIDLYYRLFYPEKFWKIVNFYYNSGKAWIPGRNTEKLEKVIQQEKEKQIFLNEVFRRV